MNEIINSTNVNNFLYNTIEKDVGIYLKIIIFWIAVHGCTDIITYDQTKLRYVLIVQSGSCILVSFINRERRFYVLLFTSLYHVGKDFNIFISLCVHVVWIYKPISSLVYLSLIHVPLHYYRFVSKTEVSNIMWIIIILNISTVLCIPNGILNNYHNMWWVGPILGHIILNI
jgi:hypothetical protein